MTVTKIYEIDSVIYCKDCGWNMEAYTDVFATNNGMIRADWFIGVHIAAQKANDITILF